MPVWRTRLGSLCSVAHAARQSLALPTRVDVSGLFQFKFTAVERHHFGNAADFDLADIYAVT
jgi:hypothetical protein